MKKGVCKLSSAGKRVTLEEAIGQALLTSTTEDALGTSCGHHSFNLVDCHDSD